MKIKIENPEKNQNLIYLKISSIRNNLKKSILYTNTNYVKYYCS